MERSSGPGGRAREEADGLARLAAVDLNLLVPLLALLEERSVTAAATRVGMTQPALSHALRRMRRLMGDELLVRDGSTMALTPRAMDLVAPLRRALRHTADVVRPAGFDPATDTRTITLAMTGSTALPLMGELAWLVGERAPNMVLRLRTLTLTGPADTVFTHEGVDVLLLPRAFATTYPREPLYDDRWVVLTGGSAPDRPVEELIETLPHVVLDSTTYRVRPYEVLDERGLRYAVHTRVSDNLLIPHVVAATGGLAFHRHVAVADMARYLDLRLHEFPFPIGRLGIDLVWNPWLAGEELRGWLGSILREAVARTGA
jgi:DNA-binding transcriptional LysR family regulator